MRLGIFVALFPNPPILLSYSILRHVALTAALRFDSRAIRAQLKVKSTRFACRGELLELTGPEPGAVPPFGEPILPMELYADPSVFENERVA